MHLHSLQEISNLTEQVANGASLEVGLLGPLALLNYYLHVPIYPLPCPRKHHTSKLSYWP